ncbi:MAG TPA: ATP synthase F1 subunit delta [Egibacteraceae bacterium]|nr:ATP synthase F1 subunit delta [Egibacteraceae bacterium]
MMAPGERNGTDPVVAAYARAIMEVAQAEDVLDRVEDDLFRFARTVEATPDLRDRLVDPAIDVGPKLAVLDDLLGGHPHTAAAAMWIVQSGRARQLTEIADALVALSAATRSAVVAEVRSAVPLTDEQQRKLASALSRSTDADVEVKVVVDPSVVGGMVVKMGDTVIDGSVARRLAELRGRLTGAS